ncbi:MAG: hypothetical protein D6799_05070, partial [Bacteroidetes bacterium]
IIYQGIPFASDLDIFLNKIYVAGRRIDDKDIFDIAFLYNKYQEKWDFQFIKNRFEKNSRYKVLKTISGRFFHWKIILPWMKPQKISFILCKKTI